MQHINTQRDVYRDQVRKMRENRLLRTLTIETLATKINELEYKLAHEPGADKNLEKQIEELNGLRPKLRELADIEHKLAKTDESRKSVQQRLADCDAILQNIKTQEEAERATLDERKAAQGGNEVDVPTLNAEKQEVRSGGTLWAGLWGAGYCRGQLHAVHAARPHAAAHAPCGSHGDLADMP